MFAQSLEAKTQEEFGDKIASENDDMIGHNVEVQEIFFFVFKIYELIIQAVFNIFSFGGCVCISIYEKIINTIHSVVLYTSRVYRQHENKVYIASASL